MKPYCLLLVTLHCLRRTPHPTKERRTHQKHHYFRSKFSIKLLISFLHQYRFPPNIRTTPRALASQMLHTSHGGTTHGPWGAERAREALVPSTTHVPHSHVVGTDTASRKPTNYLSAPPRRTTRGGGGRGGKGARGEEKGEEGGRGERWRGAELPCFGAVRERGREAPS